MAGQKKKVLIVRKIQDSLKRALRRFKVDFLSNPHNALWPFLHDREPRSSKP
jgi:hypothetical protein